MSTSLIQTRVDTSLKEEANALFDRLGLDMSTAIRIFLKKCLAENGIPFDLKTEAPKSTKGLAALYQLQQEAADNGLTGMPLDAINAEIAAARAEKRKS